jgi:hypothetical protein
MQAGPGNMLCVSLCALVATEDVARDLGAGLALARACGATGVLLDGARAGLRARELSRSARRDVAARVRREGLVCAGVDLWVPPGHFALAGTVDRAREAVREAFALAAEVGALSALAGRARVSVELPGTGASGGVAGGLEALRTDLADEALRAGVVLVDHGVTDAPAHAGLQVGLDVGALLLAQRDAVMELARLGERAGLLRWTDAGRSCVCPPGQGRMDALALRAIVAMHAGTLVALDGRGLPDPAGAVRAGAQVWHGAGAPVPGALR